MPDFVCKFAVSENWSSVISARDQEHAAERFPAMFLLQTLAVKNTVEVRAADDPSTTWRFVVTWDESGLWVASPEKAIVRRGTPGRGKPDPCQNPVNGRTCLEQGESPRCGQEWCGPCQRSFADRVTGTNDYRLADEIADTILRSSDITDKFKAYFEDPRPTGSRALGQKVELIKAIRSLYGCGLSDATIAVEAARGRYVDRTSSKPPEVWETCPDCEGSGEAHDGHDYGQCGECGGNGKVRVDSGLSAADLVSDSTPPYASLLLCNRAADGRVTMWLGKRLLFQIDPGPIDALAEALSLLLGSTGTGESFSFNLGTGEVIES